jgi:lipoate-protein ligase A
MAVPVLRRCTGGGTVLQGPGCLNFSLLLKIEDSGPLGSIAGTNAWVMQKHRRVFSDLLRADVEVQGQIDLTLDRRKFSGNAQRRRRAFLLFHGTFLLNLDIARMEQLLPLPSKQPDYRGNREHSRFVRNLPLPAYQIRAALREAWDAHEPLERIPWDLIRRLEEEKYSRPEWTFRFE